MKLMFLCVFVILCFVGKHLSEAAQCGFCEPKLSISPETVCRTTKLSSCSSSYRCGWLKLRRCTRYTSCYKTELKCCRGIKKGNYCEVSGCGGCSDNTVMNQPTCYRSVRYTYNQRYTYNVKCGGGSWWRRTKYCPRTGYRVQTAYKRGSAYCCSGFTLTGNRCICQH